jgi:serine protease Do
LAPNPSADRFLSNSFAAALYKKPVLLLPNVRTEQTDMAIPGFGEIAEQLRRSTVLIHSGGRGSGSGVIWSNDGTLVTNAHVVRSSRPSVQLWDGREFQATIHSRDSLRDLAQLRIKATNLPAATAADSSQLRPGELAIAIGNPMGFVGALATGVIHGVGPLRGLGSHSWVQAEVRLAPGNSGGPLADASGRVVGINAMVAGRLALAIPSNAVRDFLSATPNDGRLGVTLHPAFIPSPASRGKAFGLVVLEIEPESPAALASLLPGDILLGTEEKRFASLEDLARALEGSGPRALRLEFLRGDYQRIRRVTVQLGNRLQARSSVAA